MKPHGYIGGRFKPTVFILMFLFTITCYPEYALADEREHKVEAAFLYNFLNYITWPGYNAPDAMKTATICIDRGDPVYPYLNYMQWRVREERRLSIRAIGGGDPLDGCHVFFTRNPVSAARLKEAAAAQVLAVSNRPRFVEQGGMIGLMMEGGYIVTHINHSALKSSGFQVSSRLLSMAREVR